jgi:hypothetical protein
MQNFFRWIDETAGLQTGNPTVLWLERTTFVFLILTALSAPHSIAATQTAWLVGMFFWLIRLFIKPRPAFKTGLLDYALWAFFGWSVVSSVFSYAPDISLDKLRGAAVFLIFYFACYNLRTFRAARLLIFTLILSCMVNVVWTPIERIIGRGVEIHGLAENSPLKKALLQEGDTILKANKRKIKTPDDLVAEIEQHDTTQIYFYRPDFYFTVEVKKSDLLGGTTSLDRLGLDDWKRSRVWRSSGFYGHYTTYAEVLQLILSLAFGLLMASFLHKKQKKQEKTERFLPKLFGVRQFRLFDFRFQFSPFLLFCVMGMSFALLLTVTRASQLAFLLSAFSIVFLTGRRKTILTLSAIALPIVLIGLLFLQQSRQIGFFDTTDASTNWRLTVYREGLELWTANARNFIFGVGMDSIKRYAQDWHLFDDGKLPMGHFHSTPLQLLVERGLPALLLWLLILGIYGRKLLTAHRQSLNTEGLISGLFGGLIGFFVSGLVHYNLGDQEVAMIFYLLMAVGIFVCNSGLSLETHNSS